MLQKLKNFIWNDLPLRLSTYIVISVGILPIIFCYIIICYFLKYSSYDSSTPLGFLLYLSSDRFLLKEKLAWQMI